MKLQYIYEITNLLNYKTYIGKHLTSVRSVCNTGNFVKMSQICGPFSDVTHCLLSWYVSSIIAFLLSGSAVSNSFTNKNKDNYYIDPK